MAPPLPSLINNGASIVDTGSIVCTHLVADRTTLLSLQAVSMHPTSVLSPSLWAEA